jgi:hypothetical protein
VKIPQAFNGIVGGQLILFTIINELKPVNCSVAEREVCLAKGILKKIFGYKEEEELGEWRKLQRKLNELKSVSNTVKLITWMTMGC